MDDEPAGKDSAGRIFSAWSGEFVCRSVTLSQETFGDLPIVRAEEFVIAKGVVNGVVEDPDVGEFGRRFVSGSGFYPGAEFFNGFRELRPIFLVELNAGRGDGTNLVGDVISRAVSAKGKTRSEKK